MPEHIEIDELVAADSVAAELGVKVNTLTSWRVLGRGPAFLKVGRRVLYRRSDLAAWLGMQRKEPATVEARRLAAEREAATAE